MAETAYPASLPGPSLAPYQPQERRQLSTLPGPRQGRPMQRDRGGAQQVEFIYTHAEVAIYEDWRENSLLHAGAWFNADWPLPMGGSAVRRFVGEPSNPVYYPDVGWRVSAQVEIRGRGMVPVPFGPLILLRFDAPDASQIFTDEGLAEAVWTPSSGGVVIDDGALRLPTDASTLGTPYDSGIALDRSDWTIEFAVTPDAGAVDARYWFGVFDGSGVTAWAFYTGIVGGGVDNKMNFFWHDEANVEHHIPASITVSASVRQHFAATRFGNTITLWQQGNPVATASFSGRIRQPGSAQLNIGKVVAIALTSGKAGLYHFVRVFRGRAIYRAPFTPPISL